MLFLLALLACTSGSPDKEDADGDGLLASVDCNDNDASIGLGSTFFGDGDGDGFGVASITVEACSLPDGFADNAEDCNDADVLISPAGTEHCDGADEDCDGSVDEEPTDPSTFYTDADGDGFGDPAASTTACSAPTGTVADNSDCNDQDNGIYPGAEEHCDGVDEDCDSNQSFTGTTTATATAAPSGGPAASPRAASPTPPIATTAWPR
jgi:large repetitive protein